jgi:hypothetical protein
MPVQEFYERLSVDNLAQMAMMFSVAAEGLSIREAACNWLRAPDNAKEWTTWIPAQVCPVGTRLDTSSVNGSSCQECPPGSVSQGVRATACTKCAAGTRTRTHARAHGMLMGKRIHAHGRRTPCGVQASSSPTRGSSAA